MGTGFRDLKVWQEARAIAVEVYRLASVPPLSRDFGLKDQMCRSAVSVASNIAEGDERGGDREAVRFFQIAKGSIAELRTQLEIATEVGFVERAAQSELDARLEGLARSLAALARSRSQTFKPPPSHL